MRHKDILIDTMNDEKQEYHSNVLDIICDDMVEREYNQWQKQIDERISQCFLQMKSVEDCANEVIKLVENLRN